jgi:NAD(P)-dependent dehydrogenase (short-subunit alcohol dehydrogenase family)
MHGRRAEEWQRWTLNLLSPSPAAMHDPAACDALAKRHPFGRVGDIDDVVKGELYLENSPFVTGEILHVDGGQSAGH